MKTHTRNSVGILTDPTFVTTHYVSTEYHRNHPQLVHKHRDELELLYFISGEGPYIVAGREHYVTAGSLVVCDANVMHGESSAQMLDKESYCCVLKNVQIEDLPPNTLLRRGANPVIAFDKERDRESLEHIYLALHRLSSAAVSPEVCQHLGSAILLLVLNQLQKRQEPLRIMGNGCSEEEFVQSIADFLDQHYAENLSLEDLSEQFHISSYYVSKFFKKGTGIAPTKYIMNRRIGEAQNLLMNTDIPIGDIGAAVGIDDVAYFSKQFKKYVGVTPSAFRSYHRDQKDKNGQEETVAAEGSSG